VHGEVINAHKTFVGKSKGKRLRGGLRLQWKDNIKMNLKDGLLSSLIPKRK
jgi:hypothetical protein